jgi:glycerate 2-kinase
VVSLSLKNDAYKIIDSAITAALPGTAVKKALQGLDFSGGKIIACSDRKGSMVHGKSSSPIYWVKESMTVLLSQSMIIPKVIYQIYGFMRQVIPFLMTIPLQLQNRLSSLVSNLTPEDKVLFLISGGGSALFEKPLIPKELLEQLTKQLLASGADIVEMNTIRKRLSAVKGGKFAKLCEPAQVFSVVLSDIIGDPLDMIASGPAYPDSSTSDQALEIIKKYNITVSDEVESLLKIETPDTITNVKTMITGSVTQLCAAAEQTCLELGYEPVVLTASLSCEAREAGSFLASIAQYHNNSRKSLAFIAGGETIVHLKGSGKGGRNQELALAAAEGISDLTNTAVFSIGSDGTDGPTDAAGGYVDTNTKKILTEKGIAIFDVLENNDAYHGLKECDGLIITGPTGTNVNDLSVLLIKR